MALTKKPVTGMKDITPAEMQIREYVMNQIRETYKAVSYTHLPKIMTRICSFREHTWAML